MTELLANSTELLRNSTEIKFLTFAAIPLLAAGSYYAGYAIGFAVGKSKSDSDWRLAYKVQKKSQSDSTENQPVRQSADRSQMVPR
jgi:hypothetical protein